MTTPPVMAASTIQTNQGMYSIVLLHRWAQMLTITHRIHADAAGVEVRSPIARAVGNAAR